MNRSKRYLTNNNPSPTKTKFSRTMNRTTKESANCLENLSNELFFEIFDYIEGCTLYKAFSNLNERFQLLLDSSSIRFKIDITSHNQTFWEYYFTNFIRSHKYQIISFRINKFSIFSWFSIDSTLQNLKSIILTDIPPNELILILISLVHLPNLSSLTTRIDHESIDFNIIYQLIFSLPRLKYNKLSSNNSTTNISSLMKIHPNCTAIEHLVIDHTCTLNDLLTIASYTPQLTTLLCKQGLKSNLNNEPMRSVTLSYLKNLSIPFTYITFNEFELFIKKISSQLQSLLFNTHVESAYLNADRWEYLIEKFIPNLKIFDFAFINVIENNFEITPYHKQITRFNSEFWLKKQWIYRLELRTNSLSNAAFVHKINPKKRRFTGYNNVLNDPSAVCSPLSIFKFSTLNNEALLNTIRPFLLISSIKFLNIQCPEIFLSTIIELIRSLPNLNMLAVNSSSITVKSKCATNEQLISFQNVSNTNKITKIALQNVTDATQVEIFLRLCPNVQQLELYATKNINPDVILSTIFKNNTRYISNLSVLGLCIFLSNEEATKKIKDALYQEGFSRNCLIKIPNHRIYLRCSKQ